MERISLENELKSNSYPEEESSLDVPQTEPKQ